MQSVRRVVGAACLVILLSWSVVLGSSKSEISRQIRFGADMARQGNWHEAIFRWQRSLKLDPDNPRIHNNLAVAYESLGEYDKALAEYRAALAVPGVPPVIMENHELFLKFYERYKEDTSSPSAPPPAEAKKPEAKDSKESNETGHGQP